MNPTSFTYAPKPVWPKRIEDPRAELAIVELPAKAFGARCNLFAIRRWNGQLPQLFSNGYVRKLDAERIMDTLETALKDDRALTLRGFKTRFADSLAIIPPHDSTGNCHMCHRDIDQHNAHELHHCAKTAFDMIHSLRGAKK